MPSAPSGGAERGRSAILSKLDVGTRGGDVARARSRHLIPT